MLVLILTAAIALLDQLSKYVVRRSALRYEPLDVVPGCFSLTCHLNDGAAWGMLGGWNGCLALVSLLVILLLVAFRRRLFDKTRTHRVAMGCMIGGILGNAVDRLRLGGVVDWLDFYIGRHHWPAFNVADAALCAGVGIYMIAFFLAAKQTESI
ncbi:MAG: signal peptidase II [Kiritimatiellae bacterium]|nr:signal peptidase II [Kiritimatiellia bacterium]